jgi:hypothetical protein
MSRDDVGQRRRIAFVGNVNHLETRLLEEQSHRQMVQAANARRAVGRLALVRAHIVDEFLQRMDRQVLVDDQRERIGANVADRSEILERVVTHLLDRRHDRHHRQCGKEQGVAVRRRLSDKIGGDSPARTRFILDDERAAKSLAETLRYHARETVGVAAGGKGHNDRHRPLRPVGLCRYRGCCEKSANRDTKDGSENWQDSSQTHFTLHWIIPA